MYISVRPNPKLENQYSAMEAFAINLCLRFRVPPESNLPLALSVVGVFGIGVGGWLGGKIDLLHRRGNRPAVRRAGPN